MTYRKTKRDKVLETLQMVAGNINETCKLHAISRRTYYDWVRDYEDFREEANDIIEGVVDNVESAHFKAALEGNVTAQIFILKTKGKKRGYVESQELDISTFKPIVVSLLPDRNKDEGE